VQGTAGQQGGKEVGKCAVHSCSALFTPITIWYPAYGPALLVGDGSCSSWKMLQHCSGGLGKAQLAMQEQLPGNAHRATALL
jgi:hypothetical protein